MAASSVDQLLSCSLDELVRRSRRELGDQQQRRIPSVVGLSNNNSNGVTGTSGFGPPCSNVNPSGFPAIGRGRRSDGLLIRPQVQQQYHHMRRRVGGGNGQPLMILGPGGGEGTSTVNQGVVLTGNAGSGVKKDIRKLSQQQYFLSGNSNQVRQQQLISGTNSFGSTRGRGSAKKPFQSSLNNYQRQQQSQHQQQGSPTLFGTSSGNNNMLLSTGGGKQYNQHNRSSWPSNNNNIFFGVNAGGHGKSQHSQQQNFNWPNNTNYNIAGMNSKVQQQQQANLWVGSNQAIDSDVGRKHFMSGAHNRGRDGGGSVQNNNGSYSREVTTVASGANLVPRSMRMRRAWRRGGAGSQRNGLVAMGSRRNPVVRLTPRKNLRNIGRTGGLGRGKIGGTRGGGGSGLGSLGLGTGVGGINVNSGNEQGGVGGVGAGYGIGGTGLNGNVIQPRNQIMNRIRGAQRERLMKGLRQGSGRQNTSLARTFHQNRHPVQQFSNTSGGGSSSAGAGGIASGGFLLKKNLANRPKGTNHKGVRSRAVLTRANRAARSSNYASIKADAGSNQASGMVNSNADIIGGCSSGNTTVGLNFPNVLNRKRSFVGGQRRQVPIGNNNGSHAQLIPNSHSQNRHSNVYDSVNNNQPETFAIPFQAQKNLPKIKIVASLDKVPAPLPGQTDVSWASFPRRQLGVYEPGSTRTTLNERFA